MAEKSKRYEWIDSFKGISILGVVLIHSGAMSIGGIIGKVSSYGSAFVQAFFVMSSFLTWVSLNKYQKFTAKDYKEWLLKKFITLAPLYYIAMIASLLITGGNQYWAGDTNPKGLPCVISHLTLLHDLFPKYCNSIIGVEWYLGVLVLFYIIAPLAYKFFNNLKRSIALFLVSNLLSIAVYEAVLHNGLGGEYSYIYDEYFYTYGLIAQLPTLSLGIVLYYMIYKYNDVEIVSKRVIYSIVCMAIALLLLLSYGKISHLFFWSPVTVPTLYGLAFAIVLFGQNLNSFKMFTNGLLGTVGRQSYGLYLFHSIVFTLYERFISFGEGSLMIIWALRYSLTIVTTLFLTNALEKTIEVLISWTIRGKGNGNK